MVAMSDGSISILLVDDDPDMRALLARFLGGEFAEPHVFQVGHPQELQNAFATGGFDLVITDYQIQWTTGLAVLREVKSRWPDCPVIMFTATGSEEIAVEAMKADLDDYIIKAPAHFARLALAVRSTLSQARQRRALTEAETRYRGLFDGVPVGLYQTTLEGQILDANPALLHMLGYPDLPSLQAIGEWVLRAACAQNKVWQQAGLAPVRMAVNLSVRQLRQSNLVQVIGQALEDSGLEPQYLELELTESMLMQNAEVAIPALGALGAMGIEISIDDFGTGYSSLGYLKRLPIHALKIDRSFVCDIPVDHDDVAIVMAIIAMAHNLGIRVIAEGVETAAQQVFLVDHHCDAMQGFHLSRPIPADEAARFLGPSII